MSNPRLRNLTRRSVWVPGLGAIRAGQTRRGRITRAARELEAAGVLRITPAPTPPAPNPPAPEEGRSP